VPSGSNLRRVLFGNWRKWLPKGTLVTAGSGMSMQRTNSRVLGRSGLATVIREMDWSQTPLGDIESWPETLLTAINWMLAAPLPMQFFWGPELICIYNDAMAPALSDKHPGSLGRPAREVWSEAWFMIGSQLEQVLTEGRSFRFDDILLPLLRNGVLEDQYWTYSYSPIFATDGTVVGALDVAQDTTGRVIAEQQKDALKHAAGASEERTRLALSAANGVGTWDWDVAQDLVYADAQFAAIYGVDPERARRGLPISEFVRNMHPEDRDDVQRKIEKSMQTGEEYRAEYRLVQTDGSVLWVLARGHCSLSSDRVPIRFAGVTVDITQRKHDEELLKQKTEALTLNAERLRLAQEAGKSSSWEWDLASGVFIWDEGSRWTYGRSPSEMAHIDQIWEYVHKDDRDKVLNDLQPALNGLGEYRSQFRVCWPDGSVHWIDARGGPIFSAEGRVEKILGINMNVTDRKRSEEALIQNEKLAAVGRLAASIAHEINNPLEAVTNLIYLAKGSQDIDEAHDYLKVAEAELQRVSAITNQTLRFHRQATRPTESTCDDLFSSVLAIYTSRLTNANISVEKHKRVHRPILCLDGDIRQVLSNLVANAIDAMQSDGGRLLLRSREGHEWKTGRPGIVLTIGDTGLGMPPYVVERVFEAFFTTKGIGGTGLGMWISREIVGRHQGQLSLRSSQRKGHTGTVFTLFLPFDVVIAAGTGLSAHQSVNVKSASRTQ